MIDITKYCPYIGDCTSCNIDYPRYLTCEIKLQYDQIGIGVCDEETARRLRDGLNMDLSFGFKLGEE